MDQMPVVLKVLIGASVILGLVLILSIASPPSYMDKMEEQQDIEIGNQSVYHSIQKWAEGIKNFITSYPNNLIIGISAVVLSLVGSYYSKIQGKIGEFLRTIGPAQGYIFGAGLMLVLFSNPIGV
jgi:hypothetical protein